MSHVCCCVLRMAYVSRVLPVSCVLYVSRVAYGSRVCVLLVLSAASERVATASNKVSESGKEKGDEG